METDKRPLVMVVDDPLIADVMAQMLEDAGMRSISACGLQEAEKAYQAHKDEISLLIIDDMCGKGAYESADEEAGMKLILNLSDTGPLKARVIFISSWLPGPNARKLFRDVSGNDILDKPFGKKELLAAVEDVFSKPLPDFVS